MSDNKGMGIFITLSFGLIAGMLVVKIKRETFRNFA